MKATSYHAGGLHIFNINNVSLTNSMHNALLNNTGPFISIHNHPNNSFFSVKDLLTFLSYVNMQSCIVVGNSGKIIHIMTKRNKKKTSSFICYSRKTNKNLN